MIFVTVGAQMSFDRLVSAVDHWAGARGRTDVFAQIGPTEFVPGHMKWAKFLSPEEFRERVAKASVIVAHAGMGSIITALEAGIPILVMPRRGHLNETRNDHQVATAQRFLELGRVGVAIDEHELPAKLDLVDRLTPAAKIGGRASVELIGAIRAFLGGELEAARA